MKFSFTKNPKSEFFFYKESKSNKKIWRIGFGWLVVLGLTARPFETVFQSISGRLPKRGRKRRKDR